MLSTRFEVRAGPVLKGRSATMQNEFVSSNPQVLGGKPVIRGTRISVELVLEKIAAGDSIEDIVASYPHLTREAVQAAVTFAAETLRADVVYPLDPANR